VVVSSEGDDRQCLKRLLKLSFSRVLTAEGPTESEAGMGSCSLTEHYLGLPY